MTRTAVSLLVLLIVLVLFVWRAPDVLLVIFAGVLAAVGLRGGGDWTAERLDLSPGWGLAIFALALVTLTALFAWVATPVLADQFNQLWARLPQALDQLRGVLQDRAWAQWLLDQASSASLFSGGIASTAVTSTFGALGNIVVILFIGGYGAAAPQSYLRGAVALLAPPLRAKGRAMIREAGRALRQWLAAQLVSMAIIGALTGLGLWALGIPLALILAVLAALLTFIPTIGPIIAAVPAVLFGFTFGPTMALWVAALYLIVQTIESYFVTPYVQKEAVSLPPALTISSQLLLGTLFGILGLAAATPLAAMLLRLGRIFYVEQYLDQEPEATRVAAPSSV